MAVLETLSGKAGHRVEPGEIIEVDADIALSHENADLVIEKFRETGRDLAIPEKIFIVLDHRVPAESESTANLHARIRRFVGEHSIRNFYDVGNGICHEVLAESGLLCYGKLVIGTDSHTPTAGYCGAVGIGVGATDMAYVWATGKIYLTVPEVTGIALHGAAKASTYPMDIGLALLDRLKQGYEYTAFELCGEYVAREGTSARKTICNLLVETGAKTICVDAGNAENVQVDVDVSEIEPVIAMPGNPADVKRCADVQGIAVDQVFVGTCTSGRLEDIAVLASVLKGKHVHRNVRMLVAPASRRILQMATSSGYIQTLLDAGCVILPPGCGPCLGAHMGLLGDGEACLSAGNRNYQGRMGSKDAKIYLASPYTCACSALEGHICVK